MSSEPLAVQRHGPGSDHGGEALFFPPFPSFPTAVVMPPLESWQHPGIWLPADRRSELRAIDSFGMPSVGTLVIEDPVSAQREAEERVKERKLRQLQKAKLGVRLVREDCWKIGSDREWREPEGTSKSDYSIHIPPFTRLISAMRDFLNSRHEELQFNRSKRLLDSLRNAFGLRTDIVGPHVNGTGDGAILYVPPRSGQPRDYVPGQCDLASGRSAEHECCVLLLHPGLATRGFLALTRRDAEAGWDLAPALKLTDITAAFLSFLEHYRVVEEIHSDIASAASIARKAHSEILESKTLEEILCNGHGLNRGTWTLFGGEWAGPERGGLEKEAENTRDVESIEGSDGGWEVDIVIDNRPEYASAQEVRPSLLRLLSPVTDLALRGYIPFSRRRISAILPPLVEGSLAFQSLLWRVITTKAPWTDAEAWRRIMPIEDDDSDDGISSSRTTIDLERETATIIEPETLTLWCDLEDVRFRDNLVGAGLRGRWGLFGSGDMEFWTFKPKDYVLPAFWLAT